MNSIRYHGKESDGYSKLRNRGDDKYGTSTRVDPHQSLSQRAHSPHDSSHPCKKIHHPSSKSSSKLPELLP